MDLLDAALAFHHAGCAVLPTKPDGSKAPAVEWRRYQTRRPREEDVRAWLSDGRHDGFGIVTGAVSGNLEMLELEGRAVTEGGIASLRDLADASGLGDLWHRVIHGYAEITPTYGLHFLYRVQDTVAGNTKLARRPATPDELAANPKDKLKVLAETRGEGGYVVVAPSHGRTHPTGRPWLLTNGGPTTIPTVTGDERDALHNLVRALDAVPEPPAVEAPRPARPSVDGALLPGQDYNTRATWDELLPARGWVAVHRTGRTVYWRRPGKTIGVSATTGRNQADNLYVFSTSTEFDAEKPYSKFAAYTLLEHGGDWSAAAKQLRADGYGSPLEPSTPVDVADLIAPEPRRLRVVSTDGTSALAPDPAPSPIVRTLARSEDGHAQQLIAEYGHLIRYCPQRGRWLVWTGAVWEWQPENGGKLREYAKHIARVLDENDHNAVAHKRKALSAAGTSGALRQACTDPRLNVDIADLDADPWAINTPGGIVDLRTGNLRPNDPAGLHTRITRVTPDFRGVSATWDTFLDDTFGDDTALRDYVQKVIGIALIGVVLEQILPFWFGLGANGKSTLLEAVMHAVGIGETGYAIAAPAEMLMVRRHPEHPAELAQLAGSRLVVCSELEDGQRLAEARVKQLTGRDSINARFLYGQPFTFRPSHTIILAGNHKPVAKVGGPALWRRLKAVPFPRVVPKPKRDPLLGDKLADAGPVVLAWAITGAVRYLQEGLDEPAAVKDATRDYEADQDTVGRFVAEQCLLASTDQVKVKTTLVRNAYEAWCREMGEEAVTAKRFTQELRDRFRIGTTRSETARFYVGISLLSDESDDEERWGR